MFFFLLIYNIFLSYTQASQGAVTPAFGESTPTSHTSILFSI